MKFLSLSLLLLLSSFALAEDYSIKSVECHLNNGRFVATVVRVAGGGGFRAKIMRYMDNQASLRFEGPVNFAIGDTADGATVLMFASTEDSDPSSARIPEFSLTVTNETAGELYSSHFLYPERSVKGTCTINSQLQR